MVQDTLKLGGNILSKIPDMLAGQLVGRLLPEMWRSPHLEKLIRDRVEHSHWSRSSRYCALIGSALLGWCPYAIKIQRKG